MKLFNRSIAKYLSTLALLALGSAPFAAAQQEHQGIPQDWSTRHIMFPNGGSPERMRAASHDVRSWINWSLRSQVLFPHYPVPVARPIHPRESRVDWAVSLGSKGGMPIAETPAKYSFSTNGNITTANCTTDFVVFTIDTTTAATGGQASIVALNNLYTGTSSSFCPNGAQSPPTTDYTSATVMWAYAINGVGSTLSPVLSLDGTKVAYIDSGNPANLNILTWKAGQGTSATNAAAVGSGSSVVSLPYSNTTVTGCAAKSDADGDASPYIDYNNDVAYVADTTRLYRITGVFKGTPTLQYCTTVTTGGAGYLTSPIYDQVNNTVYISDGLKLYGFTPGATGFTATSPASITIASNTTNKYPVILAPYLDSTDGFIYEFSGANASNANAAVSQILTNLSSQVTASIGPVLSGNTFLLDGDFDNNYWTNGPMSGSGTLYACGDQTGGTKPSLYALSFSAPNGLMNTTPAMSNNTNINGASNPAGVCSPLLDFFDGTTDRLFVGTGALGVTTGANLITEWNVNTRISSSTTAPTNSATGYWGGSSAFTVDNVSLEPQAASIYFGTQAAPPTGTTTPCGSGNFCAVKLTQSGLQ